MRLLILVVALPPKAPRQTPTAFACLKEAVEDFKSVAYLAGLPGYDIEIEFLPAPHKPPSSLLKKSD